MNIYIAAYIVNNILHVLSAEKYMGSFFEKRRTSLTVMFFSLLLYSILMAVVYFFIGIPIISLIVGLFTVFLISLNYESSTIKRFFSTVCILAISITLEIFVFLALTLEPVLPLEGTQHRQVSAYLLTGTLVYLTSLLFRGFKNIRKNKITQPKFWLSVVITPIISLFMVIVVGIYMSGVPAFVVIITTIAINVLIFYLHDILSAAYEEKLKSAIHAQEREYYLTQCRIMQESVNQVQSIRHDMNVHLTVIRGYSTDNKAVTDYLDNLLGSIGESKAYSDTGNVAFDSIINFKLKTVKDDNINLDIYLSIPEELNVEVVDIAIILGNLLDNAMDAVAKVSEKMIKLSIVYDRECLLIKIENTFDGTVEYIKGTDNEGKRISTRKNGSGHGHGIKNIRKSVEKYNGYMDVSHTGNVFSVGVMLYVDTVSSPSTMA